MSPRIVVGIGGAMIVGLVLFGAVHPGGGTTAAAVAADAPAPLPVGPIKSVRVTDAKAAYEAEVRRAETDRANRVLAAKRAYKAVLDAAKAQAMKQGDLNEANRIQAEIVTTEAEIKAGAAGPAAKAGGLVITAARYGIPGEMKDVTELVRSKVIGDALPSPTKGLPDPAFGKMKTFVLEGTYGGREFVLDLPEEFPAARLYFGPPPKAKP
jgi:hypothetical protein